MFLRVYNGAWITAGAVELRNAVIVKFGIELPATVTFDYPTIEALAGFVAARVSRGSGQAATLRASLVSGAPDSNSGLTEIVGISSSVAASGELDAGEHQAAGIVWLKEEKAVCKSY